MAGYFNKEPSGKWSVQFTYEDYTGNKRRKRKLGFKTKKEAVEWMEEFKRKQKADIDMKFSTFIDDYFDNMKNDLRESTMITKKHMIELHILPYFKDKKVVDITALDVKKWQNEIRKKGFSDTYLKTINSQLSAIFNHACKFYRLGYNPCKEAGYMGKNKSGNMGIWTQDDIELFLEAVSDKPVSRYAFMVLYWTGLRLGELLALNIEDINLEEGTLKVSKSLQRLGTKDVITEPKTEGSNRIIYLPKFLQVELEEYINMLYGRTSKDRLFLVTKSFLEKEIKRGANIAGLTPIRVHDLRHSHASLLISKNVDIATVSKRLGHDKIKTTLDTYAHMFEQNARGVADILDQLNCDNDKEEL